MKENSFGQIIKEIAAKHGISQVELATKSRVSRVQINRIFSGTATGIRPETRSRLLAALGLDDEALGLADSLGRYRKKIHERYLVKSLAGLGFAELQKQPLNTFYVSPVGVRESFGMCGEGSSIKPQSSEQDESRDVGSAVESIAANQRMVILGTPGAGKTTLLQFLATESAQGSLGKTNFPLFVRLPEFALAIQEQPDLGVFDWVVSQAESMECPGIAESLVKQLNEVPCPVISLFDGLDEVPGQDSGEFVSGRVRNARTDVVQAISKFIVRYPNQKVVVSSRLTGFAEVPWSSLGFQKLTLSEYGEDQIREAVAKWSTILSNSKQEPASKISRELTDAIFENRRVKQLAGNPLILTILILMCKARGYALPRRRVDLYEKVAEVFLDSWESSKRKEHGFRETGNIDLDTRELKWLIAELALAMQKAGIFTAHRWWIIDHIRDTLCERLGFDDETAKRQCDPILRFISARAGLLDERVPNVFAFTHRTMQEFFAAIGLIEASIDDPENSGLTQTMRPYFHHPEWSEVVRLTVAQISPSPAEELMKAIVNDTDPTGIFLQRGRLLAIKCLADGATVSDRDFVQDIFRSFEKLGESRWLGITFDVFAALTLLNGTRYEHSASEVRRTILSVAKSRLPEDNYRALLFAADRPNPVKLLVDANELESPVLESQIDFGGSIETQYFPNFSLFAKHPDRWLELATKLLESIDANERAKKTTIWFMVYAINGDSKLRPKFRKQLKRTLKGDSSQEVRAVAVRGLAAFLPDDRDILPLLLKMLSDIAESVEVRSACAAALEQTARQVSEVRAYLLDCLQNTDDSETVRAAAASGLEDAAKDSDLVADVLYRTATADPSDAVRCAAVFSLAPVCEKLKDVFESWLMETSAASLPAGKVLADAYVSGKYEWDEESVRRIESQLMRAGVESLSEYSPRSYVLSAIKCLANARVQRGGFKLETVINEKLRAQWSKIEFAFVYGSVLEERHSQEGDIDLMLIGSVTTDEVNASIREIEALTGRQVKLTAWSVDAFRASIRNSDQRIQRVLDSEKRFLAIGRPNCRQKVVFREFEIAYFK